MIIRMIAAVSENGVIGNGADILWDMPADIAFFKKQIESGWLLTGRKSFESAQGSEIFENRKDVIIVTRNTNYTQGDLKVAHHIEEAIAIAKEQDTPTLNVLGGGTIYRQMMPFASQLIITWIHHSFQGNTTFPEIDTKVWKIVRCQRHSKDQENPFDYSFSFYERV